MASVCFCSTYEGIVDGPLDCTLDGTSDGNFDDTLDGTSDGTFDGTSDGNFDGTDFLCTPSCDLTDINTDSVSRALSLSALSLFSFS